VQWGYEIFQAGKRLPIAKGQLDAADFTAAHYLAVRIALPEVTTNAPFQVRLSDSSGTEVWRGKHIGCLGRV
jgi:hypothetical protein